MCLGTSTWSTRISSSTTSLTKTPLGIIWQDLFNSSSNFNVYSSTAADEDLSTAAVVDAGFKRNDDDEGDEPPGRGETADVGLAWLYIVAWLFKLCAEKLECWFSRLDEWLLSCGSLTWTLFKSSSRLSSSWTLSWSSRRFVSLSSGVFDLLRVIFSLMMFLLCLVLLLSLLYN